MNKKGQIFLVGAVIIVLALLTVTGKYNSVKEYPVLSDYKDQTDNYLTEYPKVVNNAIYQNLNQKNEVTSFSTIFLGQARSKDPNFGVLYSYKDNDGKIHIVNTLTNRVITIKLYDTQGRQVQGDIKVYGENVNDNSGVCINGIGCSSVVTQAKDFGGRFDNDIALANAQSIKICLDNQNNCISDIRVKAFSDLSITSSSTLEYNTDTGAQIAFNADVTVSII